MDTVLTWKHKVETLKKLIRDVKDEYKTVLDQYPDMRDEAGDPGKHDVDDKMRSLESVKDSMCALKGGSKGKKTRKHRR